MIKENARKFGKLVLALVKDEQGAFDYASKTTMISAGGAVIIAGTGITAMASGHATVADHANNTGDKTAAQIDNKASGQGDVNITSTDKTQSAFK